MDYRSKATFKAFQVTEESIKDNSTWPEFMHRLWNNDRKKEPALWPDINQGSNKLVYGTLEKHWVIEFGDYLCCADDRGRLLIQCMKKKEFEDTFEPCGKTYPLGVVELAGKIADEYMLITKSAPMPKTIGELNKSNEGWLVLAAIAKLTTESQTNKTPDEVLAQCVKLVESMKSDNENGGIKS